jgi:hypothetical protein
LARVSHSHNQLLVVPMSLSKAVEALCNGQG